MLGRIVPSCLVSAYILSLHAGIVCADALQRRCSDERIRSETTLTLYNDRTEQEIKKGIPPPILECNSRRSGAMLKSTRRGVRPTKVVMHGFLSSGETMLKHGWREARKGGRRSENLIIVDWSSIAKSLNYRSVAACAVEVGKYLGHCLIELKVTGDKLHLFGHSLGAHGVGMAGRVMGGKSNRKFFPSRVTGMDPAGPCFSKNFAAASNLEVPIQFFTRCDAKFGTLRNIGQDSGAYVDIVHSNPGQYGQIEPLGHVDYYVNEGSQKQELCSGFKSSHSYAVKVVVLALRHGVQVFTRCDMKRSTPFCREQKSSSIPVAQYFDLQKDRKPTEGNYTLKATAACKENKTQGAGKPWCKGRNYSGGEECCEADDPENTKCTEGQGDCDTDAGCAGDLVCGKNNCRDYHSNASSKDDCCTKVS